jgi:hypothetical protein
MTWNDLAKMIVQAIVGWSLLVGAVVIIALVL